MSGVFTGAGLALESITSISPIGIRVKFTQDPLAASSSGSHDALNIANYAITGPTLPTVTSVSAVSGDTQSFDVFLSDPLVTGTYTLSVANIQTSAGDNLQAPTSLTLTVQFGAKFEPVPKGAVNEGALDVLVKFFNPALKGDAWDALLAALAKGEQQNWDNVKNAFKQLFLATAEGDYLVARAADQGVDKPHNVAMSDPVFRKFALAVTNNKLTEEAFLEVLEVFYGSDAVRASDITATHEPYALQDGDDLTILVDEETSVAVTFNTADFARISQALAIEVAMAITRAFILNNTNAFALSVTDSETGTTKVRIYSPSRGLKSSIRTTGGKAQNILQFSSLLSLPSTASSSFPTWNITVDEINGIARFTTTGASNLDLSGLQIGDYVNIFGTQFVTNNRGSFKVTNISVTYSGATVTQYFEFANSEASVQSSIAQTLATDIMFFRPVRKTVHTAANRAVVVSVPGAEAVVKVPATSQAVNRTEFTAAYGQLDSTLSLTSLSRTAGVVTVVSANHGMAPGDWFFLDNVVATLGSYGDLNGLRQVATVTNANTFTFNTDTTGSATATSGTITPFKGVKSSFTGPYVFDHDSRVAITRFKSGLLQDISANHQYGSLDVVDATQFPDAPGYLCVAFGQSSEANTVPYLGRLSSTSLLLDYSYVFPADITGGPVVAITAGGTVGSFTLTTSALSTALPDNTPLQLSGGSYAPEIVYTSGYIAAGATSIPLRTAVVHSTRTSARGALVDVAYVNNKGAFIPTSPESVGSFYLTDSAAGRVAALSTLLDIAGAGLVLEETVIYPGDRGLAHESYPTEGDGILSDIVRVFGEE